MLFVMFLGTEFVRCLLVVSLLTVRKMELKILQIFQGCMNILVMCCRKLFFSIFLFSHLSSLTAFRDVLVMLCELAVM
jgi:hypothetical protein